MNIARGVATYICEEAVFYSCTKSNLSNIPLQNQPIPEAVPAAPCRFPANTDAQVHRQVEETQVGPQLGTEHAPCMLDEFTVNGPVKVGDRIHLQHHVNPVEKQRHAYPSVINVPKWEGIPEPEASGIVQPHEHVFAKPPVNEPACAIDPDFCLCDHLRADHDPVIPPQIRTEVLVDSEPHPRWVHRPVGADKPFALPEDHSPCIWLDVPDVLLNAVVVRGKPLQGRVTEPIGAEPVPVVRVYRVQVNFDFPPVEARPERNPTEPAV